MFSSLDLFKVSKGVKLFFFVFLFIFLALFVGLREEIGFDYNNYEQIYSDSGQSAKHEHLIEYGYRIVNNVFVSLALPFSALLLFIAFLSLGLKFLFIGRSFDFIFIPILFYLSYYLIEYEMSGIRQAVAMGFAMTSLFYVRTRQLVPFIACIIAGAMFHVSIIFFVPIFFCRKVNFSVSTSVTILIAGIFLLYVNFSELLLRVAGFLPLGHFIMDKVTSYSRTDMHSGLTLGHAAYVLFACLFLVYKRKVNDQFYDTLLTGFIFGVFCSFIFSGSLAVLNRLCYYYLMLGGLLFSFVFLNIRYTLARVFLLVSLSFFLAFKVFESISDPIAEKHYVPYKNVLEQKD